MKKILLIFLSLAMVYCEVKQKDRDVSQVSILKDTFDLAKIDQDLAERIGKIESTPAENYFVLTLSTDSTCKIEWGNKQTKKRSIGDYYFSEAGRLHFDWENNDFLVLRAGRGSDAWFNVFLPLRSSEQDERIENTLTQDLKRNLVVAEYASRDTAIVIYNLENKARQYIVETDKCGSAFVHHCIDSIAFTDNALYYRWALPNRLEENPKRYDRKVRIKI